MPIGNGSKRFLVACSAQKLLPTGSGIEKSNELLLVRIIERDVCPCRENAIFHIPVSYSSEPKIYDLVKRQATVFLRNYF